jgi:elongation factor Tu
MHELVEMEVRELLSNYEYDGDDATLVKGSALKALEGSMEDIGIPAIEQLVDAMDREIPIPERATEKDFMMSIEGAHNISGRGTVVTGTIDQGECKVGQDAHLIGIQRKPTPTTITGIETFHK